MTIETITARLDELEMARQAPQSHFEIDDKALWRRVRRQNAVLRGVYSREGISGLQKRHENALARGRHKLPRWQCGKGATVYSDFIKSVEIELRQMREHVEFWRERRNFLMEICGLSEEQFFAEHKHMELAWQAANAGDLMTFNAECSLSCKSS
jgi:hypothetical protein